MSNARRPGMTFEQRERAISMLTAAISNATSPLLNRFQQTRNVADRPRSGRPRKTMQWEDRFLTTSS